MSAHASLVHRLSTTQRETLIAHCNGPQPFNAHDHRLRETKRTLIELELLCPNSYSDIASATPRPHELRLTKLGSEVACAVCAYMVEQLVNAGAMEWFVPEHEGIGPDTSMETLNVIRGRIATDRLLAMLQASRNVSCETMT